MTAIEGDSARSRRIERLVAGGRVALAAASLAAVWVDPSEPAAFANATFSLIAAYLTLAAALLAVAWASPSPPRHLGLASHLFDLVMFGLVISFIRGPSSPFFLLFVFAMVSAALRLRSLPALMDRDPAAARRTAEEVEDLLIEEHRELRSFMEEARDGGPRASALPLAARLEEVASRVERDWGLRVDRVSSLGDLPVPPAPTAPTRWRPSAGIARISWCSTSRCPAWTGSKWCGGWARRGSLRPGSSC